MGGGGGGGALVSCSVSTLIEHSDLPSTWLKEYPVHGK